MSPPTAEQRLAEFIAKFTPGMAASIRAARRRMRALLPNATEFVYDNYNFFVIGYGPGERPSDAIFSLACQARGITLCFLQGAGLPDPHGLLRGSGTTVRSVRLETPASLDRPPVRALIRFALEHAKVRLDPKAAHRLVIRSVSAKQRPRRVSSSANSATPRSAAPKSAATKPTTPKPTTPKPTTPKPTTPKPTATKPAATKPAATKPTATQRATAARSARPRDVAAARRATTIRRAGNSSRPTRGG